MVKRRTDVLDAQLYLGPRGGEQNDHCQPSTGKVLLVLHILIGGDQDVVALPLGVVDQVPVIQI